MSEASIAKALVAFQAECVNVAPNQTAGKGGSFSYEYADLPAVLGELKPRLQKHGLALLQMPISLDGKVGVRTLIVHTSGEMLEAGEVLLPLVNQTAQDAGKCITYARRYALGAIAGIATEKDDDAQVQEPRGEQRRAAPPETSGNGGSAPAFDTPVGFGKKFKDRTWREMTEGSIGGERHDWLLYIEKSTLEEMGEETEEFGKPKDNPRRAEKLSRVQKCLGIIGKRADEAAANTDANQPELGDAGAF